MTCSQEESGVKPLTLGFTHSSTPEIPTSVGGTVLCSPGHLIWRWVISWAQKLCHVETTAVSLKKMQSQEMTDGSLHPRLLHCYPHDLGDYVPTEDHLRNVGKKPQTPEYN